ncbi:MAG: phosphoglycerate dehydrogenase [bacterium]|nr:phosphoglycerate dehydrogenase [bacterium]
MSRTVLVTARAFRDAPGEHWGVLERAEFKVKISPSQVRLEEIALAEMIAECDGAIIGTEPITARVIAGAPRLRVLSRFGVGVDSVDLEAATAAGVVVTTTVGANATAVAELVIGFVFSLARGIPRYDARTKRGDWRREVGVEIAGKTLGIVGLGRIGTEVALRARALGMRVIYSDPVRPAREEEAALGATHLALPDLLRESDFVSLHAPLAPETVRMIGARELALMRQSAYLINTARGQLVDEAALCEALRKGQVAGAGLDVREVEPSQADDLLCLDSVILTPHTGSQTREAICRMSVMAAENVVRVLGGERPEGVVNPDVYGAGGR